MTYMYTTLALIRSEYWWSTRPQLLIYPNVQTSKLSSSTACHYSVLWWSVLGPTQIISGSVWNPVGHYGSTSPIRNMLEMRDSRRRSQRYRYRISKPRYTRIVRTALRRVRYTATSWIPECVTTFRTPLPSNRHHRRCGDCLEGKGENYQVCSVQYYQVCSVQYCVQQLCTVRCTHIWTD